MDKTNESNTWIKQKVKKNFDHIELKKTILEDSKYIEHLENEAKSSKNPENFRFINFLFLSIITFAALILVLDTFKFQINTALPGFNLLLANFYESLKDIYLFLKDLIR